MPRWTAAVVFAVVAVYAADKLRLGLAPELLWGCPVATVLLGVGLVARSPRLVGAAFAFHLAVGAPAYLIYLVDGQSTTAASALLHLASPVAGGIAVWRTEYPRHSALLAWALVLVLLPISYLATPAALNVNLAHAPFTPLLGVSTAWSSWLANSAAAAVFLLTGNLLVRRALPEAANGR